MIDKAELQKLVAAYPYADANKAMTEIFIRTHSDFWSEKNLTGQITASGWVINSKKTKTLLTHHYKLKRWFQLGGHIEIQDSSIQEASLRELREESGLTQLKLLQEAIFDIDVHKIPARKHTPEHFHFDIRFLFEADEEEALQINEQESNEIKWVELTQIAELTQEDSVLRMVEKTKKI